MAQPPDFGMPDHSDLDISVVMPCLNEEQSIGRCVEKAWQGLRRGGFTGEVIVADNGSTDSSASVARAKGARVVHEPRPGYGSAYLRGFHEARGRIVVMGDSDDSYDFTQIPELIRPLQDGYDYVLGSRFTGTIRPGAMAWSHRYIGNPVLTAVLNLLFALNVSDAHSGLRAFTRQALDKMDLRCEGMEFASEIVIKAARVGLRVAEIPIVYHPRIGDSKLKPLTDGWRHLRYLLVLSPKHIFWLPGLSLALGGVLGESYLCLKGPSTIWCKVLLALAVILGVQLVTMGAFGVTYAMAGAPSGSNRLAKWVEQRFVLERGLLSGLAVFGGGLVVLVRQCAIGWGQIQTSGSATSLVIFGLLGTIVGAQLCFNSMFLNVLQMRNHTRAHTQVESAIARTVAARVDSVLTANSPEPLSAVE